MTFALFSTPKDGEMYEQVHEDEPEEQINVFKPEFKRFLHSAKFSRNRLE